MAEASSGLSGLFAHDPSTVQSVYDHWAPEYDADVASWGYDTPRIAVAMLRDRLVPDVELSTVRLLDIGCGTGLVGAELAATGFGNVVGIDISPGCLEYAARSNHYCELIQIDMASMPSPIADGGFGGLLCVSSMEYFADVDATCREFCRAVESGGTIVLTTRSDLFIERGTASVFAQLERDGLWSIIEVTPRMPYLQGLDDYAGIGLHYCVFERC